MKETLFALAMVFTTFLGNTQDSWKIKFNGKTVFSAAAENETKNVVKLKRTDFNKKGTFDLLYKEATARSGWKRSFLFFDENDAELLSKDSVGAVTKFDNASLKKLFEGKNKIKVYTVALPTDPNLAASVRVRRVHLATIVIQ